MQTDQLSAVIITYNEEKNIGRCLRSLAGVADEMIVLDSFSTDNTVAIARKYGAVVHQSEFEGYGTQKNTALELCTGNAVLFVDADEMLSPDLSMLILKEKKEGFPADGYSMNRLTNFCGQWIRHGSWYPDRKLRIIKNKKGKWNQALVHEAIIMNSESVIKHLRADLMHYSYDSVEELVNKNNHYSSLSAKTLHTAGKRTSRLRLFINPTWAFIYNYIFRLGFLDGLNGFIIAVNLSYFTFQKHMKLLMLQESHKKGSKA